MVMTDVAIVGAGPTGIAAAAALSKKKISTLVFDRGALGETILRMPPGMRFFSSPEKLAVFGIPVPAATDRASREEYVFYLRQIVEQFAIQLRTFENVEHIEGSEGNFVLKSKTLSGESRRTEARAVVLAGGDCVLPHRLNIPGEDLPHVSHYLMEPARYTGRRVLVVGGRNSAAEGVLRLFHAGAQVTLSYRGPKLSSDVIKYWIFPELDGLVKAGKIESYFSTTPVKIDPWRVTLKGPQGTIEKSFDDVVLLTGYEPDQGLLHALGVTLEDSQKAPKHNPVTLETDVSGVYVCGTAVAGYQERFKVFIENTRDHSEKIASAISKSLQSNRQDAKAPREA